MNVLDFDGSFSYGPKTFTEITGRKALWSSVKKPKARKSEHPRGCPVCGEWVNRLAEGHKPLFVSRDGWDYTRCRVCGMVFTLFPPTSESLDAYYKAGPGPSEWAKSVQRNTVELDLDRKKFWWALEKCGWGKAGPTPKILDIGCSTGTLLEVALNMNEGAKAHGVDLNERALAVAKKRLSEIEWSTDMPNSLFNLVVLWEVLEHVLDPQGFLASAVDMLDVMGAQATMLICVPNMNSLAARILHERAPCFGLGHINLYDPKTLRRAILSLMPDAQIEMTSIISWNKELRNYLNFHDPFYSDNPPEMSDLIPSPEDICEELYGYKLVAFVRRTNR